MSADIAIDFHNPALIRRMGIEVLTKGLGPIGALYFLRQFESGYGDYTAERDALLQGISWEEIKENVRAFDARTV